MRNVVCSQKDQEACRECDASRSVKEAYRVEIGGASSASAASDVATGAGAVDFTVDLPICGKLALKFL